MKRSLVTKLASHSKLRAPVVYSLCSEKTLEQTNFDIFVIILNDQVAHFTRSIMREKKL